MKLARLIIFLELSPFFFCKIRLRRCFDNSETLKNALNLDFFLHLLVPKGEQSILRRLLTAEATNAPGQRMLDIQDERAEEVLIDFLEFADVGRFFNLIIDLTCQLLSK